MREQKSSEDRRGGREEKEKCCIDVHLKIPRVGY